MNRNGYKLTNQDAFLNEKACDLMDTICFLSNERTYHLHFPLFSTIEYTDVEEQELLENIIRLETIYAEAKGASDYGILHHKSHLYYLDKNGDGYAVYHNDKEYCSDGPSTSAPVCHGKTPMDTLQNAWKKWSIPPVLILNADFYVEHVSIAEVI